MAADVLSADDPPICFVGELRMAVVVDGLAKAYVPPPLRFE